MLGVNVGTPESSVRVFNMDQLAITVTASNDIDVQQSLRVDLIDGTFVNIKLSDLVDVDHKSNPPSPVPDSSKWKRITLICGVVLIGLILLVTFIQRFVKEIIRSEASDLTEKLNKPENTRFDSENTIKADETKQSERM